MDHSCLGAAGADGGGTAVTFREGSSDSDELIYESERSRVVRRRVAGGTVILKRALGRDAPKRVRHETAMLERVSAVPGVVKLSPAAHPADTICFQDDGGVSLASVARTRKFSPAELLEIALELAGTLAAIHRAGMVHRDINPSNVLLVGPRQHPVLIGFDIASTSAEERPAFTVQAEIQGTLAYIAPEQTGRTGRLVDHRADLYAFGATLYELATGHAPFEGGDPFQVIRDHLLRIPTPPSKLVAQIPQAFSDIVMRLLQKEPDRRYQSADGLAADLARLIERLARGETETFPLAVNDFPSRLLPPSRLVGREPEIRELHAAFEDALAGRGNGLLIAGAPGSGKTALCNELRAIVTAEGGWFVTAKCDGLRLDSAPDAVQDAFRRLVGLLLAEPESELVTLRSKIVAALGSNLALAITVMPGLVTLLGTVGDVRPDEEPPAPGRLSKLGIDLLRAIATTRPVVFVIDDLQWSSARPLRFVDAVMSGTPFPGLLLVGAYRAIEVDAVHPLAALISRWEQSNAPPRTLHLENLEGIALTGLVQEMLRLEPQDAARLSAALATRTGGNPYDTIELINALRRDGALTHGDAGWIWDDATIRRYVGQGEVVDLLSARIAALPPESAALVGIMACLGGDVSYPLLEAAGELASAEVERLLTPALEDGLLVLERSAGTVVRFRHDRVQQAAFHRFDACTLQTLRLTLARRLSGVPAYESIAAEQYVPVVDMITDDGERLRAIAFLRSAADRARSTPSDVAVERFLATAVRLLAAANGATDSLAAELDAELHRALYRLGRLDEADVVYASIVRRGADPLATIDSTCAQISSLTIRNLLREAVTLGLNDLARIGLPLPAEDHLIACVELLRNGLYRWCDAEGAASTGSESPSTLEGDALGRAKLIDRLTIPAYYHDRTLVPWLVFECSKLWHRYGPQAVLAGPMSQTGCSSIALFNDFRLGYRTSGKVLQAYERSGFEPETSVARFWFAYGSQHWFEPFDASVAQARVAREGLLQAGDLENAGLTYYASIQLLLQCSPTLDEYAAEVEAGIATGLRTGNDQAVRAFLPHRQLARALRGETGSDGTFTDDSFDEPTFVASLGGNGTVAAFFHVVRALCAYLFDDGPALIEHSILAIALVPRIAHAPLSALAHEVRAAALVRQLRAAGAEERPALFAELDLSLEWLRGRAGDAPENFSHVVRLIEAERAWALDDFSTASSAFEAALREVGSTSPRQRALVAERAARCYLERGLERFGRLLLSEAHALYGAWGATAKVRLLEAEHPFLIAAAAAGRAERHADAAMTLSSEGIDMVGLLRASQALSSQTSLPRLKAQVVDILAALTGATSVLVVIRDESGEWLVSPGNDSAEDAMPIREAGERGLLPRTAFRYVVRTGKPLLLADAMHDDRFARDPYFAGCAQCSLLVVPISIQGEPSAMLLLENRLGRDAFSAARLDAVLLIAGQLSVSLKNAMLYASLERKVAQRTEALESANQRLAELSRTDALTGLLNRRGFDEGLAAACRYAVRRKWSVGLAMIDIDEFKKYNDRYGHPAGDACLRRLGATLRDGVRPSSDLAGRYGGEEFVLAFPDTDLAGVYAATERLRAAVAELGLPHEDSAHGVVTVSIGITAFVPSNETDVGRHLEAADVALYEAKRAGQNLVVTSDRIETRATRNGAA